MATVKGGKKFAQVLERVAVALSKPAVARIGFLEGSRYPDGTPVALVAAIQDYGAPAAGVPARPFFRNMIAAKKQEWPGAIAKALKRTDNDVEKALDMVGAGIAGQLRQSIRDTNLPPLKAATIARKQSSKPLIDSGHLLASVDHDVQVK